MTPNSEIVLVALTRRTEIYLNKRQNRTPEPPKQHFVQPIPEFPPPVLVKDLELVEATGLPIEEVNQACLVLIAEKKVRVTNSPVVGVLVNQDGHLYELLPEPALLSPMAQKVKQGVAWLRKEKFTDWEVYHILKATVTIEQVNAALQCLVHAGYLKCDAQWFSPTEAGYTYALLKS
jgi:hypothetical protein